MQAPGTAVEAPHDRVNRVNRRVWGGGEGWAGGRGVFGGEGEDGLIEVKDDK